MSRFFGKYRGKVLDNEDPLGLGRLVADVPAVSAAGTVNWAMPCVPYAGAGVGLFLIPPVDANVWVEFEGGDPNYPIWTGCFWSEGEVPADPADPTTRLFKCDGVELKIDDQSGGSVMLTVASPIADTEVTITIDSAGVVVETGSGKIEITSSQVAINSDGLVVK
jgi:uncharacterized protein involved in type VI secretion and phage assembly